MSSAETPTAAATSVDQGGSHVVYKAQRDPTTRQMTFSSVEESNVLSPKYMSLYGACMQVISNTCSRNLPTNDDKKRPITVYIEARYTGTTSDTIVTKIRFDPPDAQFSTKNAILEGLRLWTKNIPRMPWLLAHKETMNVVGDS